MGQGFGVRGRDGRRRGALGTNKKVGGCIQSIGECVAGSWPGYSFGIMEVFMVTILNIFRRWHVTIGGNHCDMRDDLKVRLTI